MNEIRIKVLAKQAMASGAAEHRPAIEMIPKDLTRSEHQQVVAQIKMNEQNIAHALRKVSK